MLTRKTKASLFALLLVLVLGCGVHAYSVWWDRVQYLNWLAWRQTDLTNIGSRLSVYAAAHSGFNPQSVDDLVTAGVLAAGEARFEDPWRSVTVTRVLVPGGPLDEADSTALLIESYSTIPDGCNILKRDGQVEFATTEFCNAGD